MKLTITDEDDGGGYSEHKTFVWDNHTEKDRELANDLTLIFDYLKQYQRELKYKILNKPNDIHNIPSEAKVNHIEQLLTKFRDLYELTEIHANEL